MSLWKLQKTLAHFHRSFRLNTTLCHRWTHAIVENTWVRISERDLCHPSIFYTTDWCKSAASWNNNGMEFHPPACPTQTTLQRRSPDITISPKASPNIEASNIRRSVISSTFDISCVFFARYQGNPLYVNAMGGIYGPEVPIEFLRCHLSHTSQTYNAVIGMD